MPVYGYTSGVTDEYGLHEMSEISFAVSFGQLRQIAAFLTDCADRAEAGEWQNSHAHLSTFTKTWKDCDVIVIHQNPAAPKQVSDA